jgi:predicted Zn-dependent protease
MKALLQEEIKQDTFLPPTTLENIENYFSWDDWKVQGLLSQGKGGKDGYAIKERKHHRCVFYTSEVPTEAELDQSKSAQEKLTGLIQFVDEPEKSWYSTGEKDIVIERNVAPGKKEVVPLSSFSSVVRGLLPIRQRRIYVSLQDKDKAETLLIRKEG